MLATLIGSSSLCLQHSCVYSGVYSHWKLIINAKALRGYSDMVLRLSKLYLYVNSRQWELQRASLKCFRLSWRKLITVEMFFSRSPRYSLWMLENKAYFFLVCFSISREVRTKRQSAFAVYLASVLQFTSEKLFVQINKIKKKNCLWKKKNCRDLTRREDTASHLPVQEYTVYFSFPNSSQAWHVCSVSLINFSH